MKLRTALLGLLLILAATSAQSRRKAACKWRRGSCPVAVRGGSPVPTPNGRASSKMDSAGMRQAANLRVVETYGKLPLSFEANQGQTDSQVKFLSRGHGYSLFLTSTEAVLELQKPGVGSQKPEAGKNPQMAQITRIPSIAFQSAQSVKSVDDTVVQMKLVGANPAAQVTGLDELPGKSNYFIGNDPKRWRTNVPTYAKVRYENVYPGIDLVYYGNQRQLEYDFVVAPGADPRIIRLAFSGLGSHGERSFSPWARSSNPSRGIDGAVPLRIDAQGDLVLEAKGSELRLHSPSIYQETEGGPKNISGGFVLQKDREVGFQMAFYDRTKPLVIDPTLVYSSFLGGSGEDNAHAIAVDSAGNAYVAGETGSVNFPTATPFQKATTGTVSAFVAKLNPSGSALLYSTYLGGNSFDRAYGIAVDSSGTAYVTGEAYSNNFPTANALQATNGGQVNVFVTRLNASGSALIFSTYLGGSEFDYGNAIALDSSGNAYVTGDAESSNFPTTTNAFQKTLRSSISAFVAKLNSTGTALQYSTLLGGTGGETGNAIAVDSSGNAYVTGVTGSNDFPTVNPFQAAFGGGTCGTSPNIYYCPDAYVTKLNATGSALVYSTFLGGLGDDEGDGIAVDSSGNAYVTGITTSINFPLSNPIQGFYAGAGDAFLAKLNPQGSALVYSTYLGGKGTDQGFAVAVDSSGNAVVTGSTGSANFPTLNSLLPATGTLSAFVTKVNPAGSAFIYSTYVGGSIVDQGQGIAVDTSGSVYIAGDTFSPDFPTVNAIQSTYGGGTCGTAPNTYICDDAFVLKISDPNPVPILNSLSPSGATAGIGTLSLLIAGSNFNLASVVQWNGNGLSTTFRSSTRLTAIVPASDTGAPGTAPVTVFNPSPGGGVSNMLTFTIQAAATNNPVPVLTSLSPPNAAAGGPAFSLTLIGSNFMVGSQVLWNGSTRATTFVSANLLTTAITASDIATAGTAQVAVVNPAPAGGPSSALPFTISSGSVSGPGPTISSGGVVNGASFAAGAPVAPGSIISIFGSNFADYALSASATPLPTTLLTTSATINGVAIPLNFVGPTQINAQVPFETPVGTATLVVTVNGVSSQPVIFPVAATAPGILLYGANRAVAVNPDGSINASNNPARPGDVIVFYMTGQGAVSNPPPDGAPALGSPLSQTVAMTTATIGGTNAAVSFSGLAPGFVGLLQVNLQIPSVAAGDQPLVVTIGGAASNSALITVASQ